VGYVYIWAIVSSLLSRGGRGRHFGGFESLWRINKLEFHPKNTRFYRNMTHWQLLLVYYCDEYTHQKVLSRAHYKTRIVNPAPPFPPVPCIHKLGGRIQSFSMSGVCSRHIWGGYE